MASIDYLIRTVAEHRQQIGDGRPYPPAGDCTLFAVTEAAELIDALLRQEPRYLRNNAKQLTPAHEAGDLGYMIASAIDQIDRGQHFDMTRAAVFTGSQIMDRLAYALMAIDRGQHLHARRELIGALEAWQELCRREGYGSPADILTETCDRITAKYAPPKWSIMEGDMTLEFDAEAPTFVAEEVRVLTAKEAADAWDYPEAEAEE